MLQILWDASALVKRYLIEAGSDTVDAFWTMLALTKIITTPLGYLETAAILRRKMNGGVLDLAAFSGARFLLQREVFHSSSFHLLTADISIPGALALIDRHNFNTSDAIILAAYLRYSQATPETCALVAADKSLLRAATAEGLATLNPEALPAADVPEFLSVL